MDSKVILLIGITGTGKSTCGNCLFNQSSEIDKINTIPFRTDSTAESVTHNFKIEKSVEKNLTIIDTIGFGDPNIELENCIEDFKTAMNKVNNKIDLVIYCFEKGTLKNVHVHFFELIQNFFLKNESKANSLLLITKCEKGWVGKEGNKSKEFEKALNNCDGKYFEFELRFDEEDDYPGTKEYNKRFNQESINQLNDRVKEFFAESERIQNEINEIDRRMRELEMKIKEKPKNQRPRSSKNK